MNSLDQYRMTKKIFLELAQRLKNIIQTESEAVATRIILMMKIKSRNGYL